jgi:hypothetical protein
MASTELYQASHIKASPLVDHSQAPPPAPLDVFRERAEARAILVSNGWSDLQTVVDELQEVAVAQRLVATHGQDAVQQILSESFARWRYG